MAKLTMRHARQVTKTVLQWYSELEDGSIQTDSAIIGRTFDYRIVDYRIDVERVLAQFHPIEAKVVLLVHRDGLNAAQAVACAGLTRTDPMAFVADLEARMGTAFETLGLDEFLRYVDHLR